MKMLRNSFMINDDFRADPKEEWMVNGVLKDVYIIKEILPEYDQQYMELVVPGRSTRASIREIFFKKKAKFDENKAIRLAEIEEQKAYNLHFGQ